jgi:hypothetical protein
MAPILSDRLFAGALGQAEQAIATLDAEGWMTIGWVTADSGRQSWDVLFHLENVGTSAQVAGRRALAHALGGSW